MALRRGKGAPAAVACHCRDMSCGYRGSGGHLRSCLRTQSAAVSLSSRFQKLKNASVTPGIGIHLRLGIFTAESQQRTMDAALAPYHPSLRVSDLESGICGEARAEGEGAAPGCGGDAGGGRQQAAVGVDPSSRAEQIT